MISVRSIVMACASASSVFAGTITFEEPGVQLPVAGVGLIAPDLYRPIGAVFQRPPVVGDFSVLDPSFAAAFFASGGGSSPNAVALTTGFADPDLNGLTLRMDFVRPGTNLNATTDSVTVVFGDAAANIGTSIGTLEAYDANGSLLTSATAMTTSSLRELLAVSAPGIAYVVLIQDADGGVVDNVQFGPLSARCPGDTNGDFRVDFADLNQVISHFNSSGPGLVGDFDIDADVDFADLNTLLSVFNQPCPD